jgi:hypothetical protein
MSKSDNRLVTSFAALIISRSKPEELDFFYSYSQIVEANRWSNWRRFLPGFKKDASRVKANERKIQATNKTNCGQQIES